MTAPNLLDELEGVVRLAEKATPGEWLEPHFSRDDVNCKCKYIYGEHQRGMGAIASIHADNEEDEPPDVAKANGSLIASAVNFLRAHHAEIAAMAKRLEAAEMDAARWRHARKLLTVDDIESAQSSYDSFGRLVSEDECKRADDAIDAAAQEGEG